MAREAWHAVIHGVAKSRTQLSDWTELNWMDAYTFLLDIPPTCIHHPRPVGHHKGTELSSLCHIAGSHQLSILHVVVYICKF